MAVIYAERRDNKRGSETDQSRQLIDEYIIQVDSDADEPSTIYDSSFANLPQVGDPHPTDPLVTVKSRRVIPTANRRWYTMEVTYDNNLNNNGSGGGGGGGIEVLKVTFSNWMENFILELDYSSENGGIGRIFQNSAGDPIKYEATRPHPMITISSQTKDPSFDSTLFQVGQINRNEVNWIPGLSFGRHQLLFENYSATSVGNNTWQEDFVFKAKFIPRPKVSEGEEGRLRSAGWQAFLLDAGFREVVDTEDGPELRPIQPKEKADGKPANKPVSSAWPLKAGKAIARENFVDDIVFLEFQVYPEMDFSQFNFDFTSLFTDKQERRLNL
jgi:hypothetical protein